MTPPPTSLVIFGGGGDLTWRKLVPALYNLFLENSLPEQFRIFGVDRQELSNDAYLQHLREGLDQFSRRGRVNEDDWKRFAGVVTYVRADLMDAAAYRQLARQFDQQDQQWHTQAARVFYLATSPTLVQPIAQHLQQAGLTGEDKPVRIVVEKPFGRDLASATQLNRVLLGIFTEKQVFRIDHYLGKETVQNVLAFRFANSVFEPVWNRRYIRDVQITVAEEVGVEHRGGYYDQSGALRDMVQNHLLQVLCMIAMEPPVAFDADEIRNKKADVLRALRPIPPDQVPQFAVRGQYGPGKADGKPVPGYRQEESVAPHSNTETFAALKLYVDNWRWEGVPFYLRTGKRLPARVSEANIQFRHVPHRSFPPEAGHEWPANRLAIRIQPDEGIALCIEAKRPGLQMHLSPVEMHFLYKEMFNESSPEAYETLLLDTMRGDATLFMRADQVEAAWTAVMPVLDFWSQHPPGDFPNYAAGHWGPTAADELLARDGHRWMTPGAACKTSEAAK